MNEKETKIELNKEPTLELNGSERQALIETAVRFLKNPKVLPTSSDNKKAFLLKKGLTESEIKQAFKLADVKEGITTDTSKALNNVNTDLNSPEHVISKIEDSKTITKKESIWFKIFRWIRNILVAGCLSFTAYEMLIKKYLFKEKSNKKKYNSSTNNIALNDQKLNESIDEMKNTLNSLKETVETMNNIIKQINSLKESNINSDDNSGIKNEIQSIKNLLLSRTQFPSLPTISPIIPSWQLETKNSIKNENENSQQISNDLQNEQTNNDENIQSN